MKKHNRLLRFVRGQSIACIALFGIACTHVPEERQLTLTPTDLNTKRDELDGARVTVQGYALVGYENYAIWTSETAMRRGNYERDCVSLMFPAGDEKYAIANKLVRISARFVKDLPKRTFHVGGCNFTYLLITDADLASAVLLDE